MFQNEHIHLMVKINWIKPEISVISVSDNTLAGGTGLDDGEFGLS